MSTGVGPAGLCSGSYLRQIFHFVTLASALHRR
jgi:hypothetical protein